MLDAASVRRLVQNSNVVINLIGSDHNTRYVLAPLPSLLIGVQPLLC
jgi:hypothetical protein